MKTSEEKILEACELLKKTQGNIPLSKILFKRLPFYFGLIFLFFCGIAMMFINPDNPVNGAAVCGVSLGSLVTDIAIHANIQRMLPTVFKILDFKQIESEKTKNANKQNEA